MIRILCICLFVGGAFMNCSSKSNKDLISGEWYWKSTDGKTTFKIIIEQEGEKIIGQYCAAAYSGNRMDCYFEKESNIKGKIKNNVANVNFYSFFGAKGGRASLTLSGDMLIWKIEKWPEGGDCFAPSEAKLTKKKLW